MKLVIDALPLEYKLLNGRARRNLDISDIINDPSGLCIFRIFGGYAKKEFGHFVRGELRSVGDD